MRDSTERPETVAANANRLSGVAPEGIRKSVSAMKETDRNWDNPFGDGTAAKQILSEIAPKIQQTLP
jgi:UDP-N-acetylglucosamine 2-epimerase (non-hydrolysing)